MGGDFGDSRRGSGRRKAVPARVLLVASRWFLILPVVLLTVLLSAGTFMVPDPVMLTNLGFKSLAMVSYDGLVPFSKGNTTRARFRGPPGQDFYVTLHLFPAAFAWECPRCPPHKYSARGYPEYAGVLSSGPLPAVLDPAPLMLRAAEEIGATGVSECYPPPPSPPSSAQSPRPPHCEKETIISRFFDAWYKSPLSSGATTTQPLGSFPLGFVLYIAAGLVALLTLANEVLIAWFPWQMRCRCVCLKSWCPYPDAQKLSRKEIEDLPEHRWDRVRVTTHTLALAYFALPAFHDTVLPALFVRRLAFVDKYFISRADFGGKEPAKGLSMHPRLNGTYLIVLWGAVGMAALAFACVVARWKLNGPGAGHITLDDLSALEPSEGASATVTKETVGAGPSGEVDVENDDDEDDDASECQGLLPKSTLEAKAPSNRSPPAP